MNIIVKRKLQHNVKCLILLASAAYMAIGIIMCITNAASLEAAQATAQENIEESREKITENPQPTQIEQNSDAECAEKSELEYPFTVMSLDWGGEQLDGFVEYQIPEEFQETGGYFPIEIQQFTFIICKNYGIDYSLILAMIEVESGYRYDAVGSCGEKGYTQIIEKWHTERMERLEASDLENPYQNIMVGIDYMAELTEEYQTSVALSIYNRGYRNSMETGALDLADKGQYQTEYSETVLERAAEIEKELMK